MPEDLSVALIVSPCSCTHFALIISFVQDASLGKHLVDGAFINASVVWLDVDAGNLATVDLERIALAAHVAEQGGCVEAKVQRVGELAVGIGDKVNL